LDWGLTEEIEIKITISWIKLCLKMEHVVCFWGEEKGLIEVERVVAENRKLQEGPKKPRSLQNRRTPRIHQFSFIFPRLYPTLNSLQSKLLTLPSTPLPL
jgi:hypothetical protein